MTGFPLALPPEKRNWNSDQAFAIQLRYRHGMHLDQVTARMSGRLTKSELGSLFDRCVNEFPFIEIVRRLIRDLDYEKSAKAQLREAGLWQRLVFQYHSHDSLAHREIYERTCGAAGEAGYTITLAMLNGWLSGGRLSQRLVVRADKVAI